MSFGRMGARYGRMGASGAVAAERPTAPVLSLVEPVTDPPSFTGAIDNTVGEGDSYQIQVQADGGDWSTLLADDTDTITAGENAADEIDVTVSALGAGSYDARMRVRSGSGPWSNWSNVVDVVIEAADVSVTYLASIADATDATTYSGGVWDGVSLGTAADNRKIVLAISARRSGGAGVVSSVTVAGSAASLLYAPAGTAEDVIEFWAVDLPTGTTGNIVVAFTGLARNRAGCGLWAVYGADSALTDSDYSTANPGSVTLTVPAGGIAIGAALFADGSNPAPSAAWSGLSERYDQQLEATVWHTGADMTSSGGTSLSASVSYTYPGSAFFQKTAYISFGPPA